MYNCCIDGEGKVGIPVETVTPGGIGVPGATMAEGVFVQMVVLMFLISPRSRFVRMITRHVSKQRFW